MPTPTEAMRSVGAALECHPRVAWFTRANSGVIVTHGRRMHLCRAGTPDFIGFLRGGRFFGVEVKATKGEATRKRNTNSTREAQELFARIAAENGALTCVVSSAEEVIAWLNP